MATTLTLNTPVDVTQQSFIVEGTIVLSGNYGGASTHGDTLNFSGLPTIGSNALPSWVEFGEFPVAGAAPTGYSFGYAPGTTQANGVLTIMNGAATEYTQGSAYSAPLLAAVIRFRAEFPAFQ